MDNPVSWFLLTTALLACIIYFFSAVSADREAHLSAAQEWRRMEEETRELDFKEFMYESPEFREARARRNRPLY